eukprot:g21618.t1
MGCKPNIKTDLHLSHRDSLFSALTQSKSNLDIGTGIPAMVGSIREERKRRGLCPSCGVNAIPDGERSGLMRFLTKI